MTPLLEAAVAAREVGLEVPNCHLCLGDKTRHEYREDAFGNPSVVDTREPCRMCHATGINPDPARLGWVAYMALRGKGLTDSSTVVEAWDSRDEDEAGIKALREPHDDTETGITTALLRLVARVGGKT